MRELPIYQCHKKVGAAKIERIIPGLPEGNTRMRLIFPDGITQNAIVDAAWMQRNPKVAVGGYYVCYIENGDKYTAYSPAEPFEAGYTLLEPKENI